MVSRTAAAILILAKVSEQETPAHTSGSSAPASWTNTLTVGAALSRLFFICRERDPQRSIVVILHLVVCATPRKHNEGAFLPWDTTEGGVARPRGCLCRRCDHEACRAVSTLTSLVDRRRHTQGKALAATGGVVSTMFRVRFHNNCKGWRTVYPSRNSPGYCFSQPSATKQGATTR